MESHVRIGSPIWQQVLANIGSDDEGEDGLPACSGTGLPSPTALGSNCSRPSSHLAGHGRARPDELASGSSSLAVAAAAASGPSSPPVWRAMLRSCAEDEPSSSSSLCRDLSRSFNLVAAARQERGSSRHVPAGASLRRMESIFSLVRCSDPTARGVSAACHPSEARGADAEAGWVAAEVRLGDCGQRGGLLFDFGRCHSGAWVASTFVTFDHGGSNLGDGPPCLVWWPHGRVKPSLEESLR